jgi:hypothetical protein
MAVSVLTKACGASNTRSTFSSLPLTHSSAGLNAALLLLLLLLLLLDSAAAAAAVGMVARQLKSCP